MLVDDCPCGHLKEGNPARNRRTDGNLLICFHFYDPLTNFLDGDI